VAAEAAVPGHRAIDRDLDVGLDQRREQSGDVRDVRAGQGAPTPRADVEWQRDDLAFVGQQRDEDTRRRAVGVRQREPPLEEAVARAFSEPAAMEAARVTAPVELLPVGQAVAVRIVGRAVRGRGRRRVEAEADFPRVGQAIAVAVGRLRARPLRQTQQARDDENEEASVEDSAPRHVISVFAYRHSLARAALSCSAKPDPGSAIFSPLCPRPSSTPMRTGRRFCTRASARGCMV
jgi:hypothetical protein